MHTIETNPEAAPLVVAPKTATRMLSVSRSKLYQMLDAGELDSYADGPKFRRITVESIQRYICRKLSAAKAA